MLPDTGPVVVSKVVLCSKGVHAHSYNYKTDEGSGRKHWELNLRTLFQT